MLNAQNETQGEVTNRSNEQTTSGEESATTKEVTFEDTSAEENVSVSTVGGDVSREATEGSGEDNSVNPRDQMVEASTPEHDVATQSSDPTSSSSVVSFKMFLIAGHSR
jgi:hypothetical protein